MNAQSGSIDDVKEGVVGPGHVAQVGIHFLNNFHYFCGVVCLSCSNDFCCLKVVSRWTGIPVSSVDQEEKDKLLHLADKLHERVVGQDEAVNLVAQAVLRSRVGLDQPGQPIGSFLFLGSTGVGKTELAKSLAEHLFEDRKSVV